MLPHPVGAVPPAGDLGRLLKLLEGLEDAFEDGRPCEWFYDNIYRTKRRILERGGFEAELEYICRQYEYIAQYVANRMFDAGVRAARRERKPDAD